MHYPNEKRYTAIDIKVKTIFTVANQKLTAVHHIVTKLHRPGIVLAKQSVHLLSPKIIVFMLKDFDTVQILLRVETIKSPCISSDFDKELVVA